MPSTNAPRIIATTAGNVSLETEIIDRQRRRRQIPIVEVRVTILPGTVKAPNILFKLALQESYAAATNYLNVQPHTATDTVRMLIKHDDLISHNHMWSSSTHVIGNDEGLHGILDDWQNAMQSGEEVDLSTGSIEFVFQYALTRAHVPAAARVGARKKGEIYPSDNFAARK